MPQKKQDEKVGGNAVETDRRHKELEDVFFKAKMDASNIDLLYDNERLVEQHLKQASEHLSLATTEPDKREEHIQAGFEHVGRVRGILGLSPVQSHSFRRYQWPFLPAGVDKEK